MARTSSREASPRRNRSSCWRPGCFPWVLIVPFGFLSASRENDSGWDAAGLKPTHAFF